jgi:hypothetical protein
MTELDDLIAEQAKDDASFQAPERGTVSLERFDPFLSEDGFTPVPREKKWRSECAIHGQTALVADPGKSTGWRCRKCNSERSLRYAARNREKMAENTRKWRTANPGWVKRYAREYKRRRYQNDPEYRARERERARRWKQKQKEEA